MMVGAMYHQIGKPSRIALNAALQLNAPLIVSMMRFLSGGLSR